MTVRSEPLKGMPLSLGLAAALATSPWAAAGDLRPAQAELPHEALARVEAHYADWLDATGAVGTIDSGLLTRIDGLDRETWEKRRTTLTAALESELQGLGASSLGAEDARALDAMRKGILSNALDPSEASAGNDPDEPHHRCDDRTDGGVGGDPMPLELALYACFEEIGNHIAFEGKPVVRTTALQWLQELDEPERRKQLFFALAPLWEAVNAADAPDSPYRRMIRMAAAQARRGGGSPIDEAAATVGVTTAQIELWLREVLAAWRTHARGPAVEPWDYWYAAASASRELKHDIPRDSVLPISERFYRDLGADLHSLDVRHDLDVRPGKAPLAYTDYIRIGRRIGGHWRPAIPRVSALYEQGGLFVLNELIHEDAHAVHEAALRVRPAFYSLGGDLFDEAFADVPAWSSLEPAFQRKYLGESAPAAASLRELFANVMLDVAWGLFDLTMLKDPSADPNAVWTDISTRYLNIVPHPELSWWALRVQLVRWPGYMINYGLGAVLTADIRRRTAETIGSFDAGNARWYPWTSKHLLRYGASLDTAALLRRFLGRPLSTEALLSQLRRLD